MSRFKKKKSLDLGSLSTASLPDIVFMLLFFFMVTTTMKEVDPLVKVLEPQATELLPLMNKSLVNYIYIGPPVQPGRFGTEPRIQLNDAFATPSDIGGYIEQRKTEVPESDIPKLTNCLKVDSETRMGIITDVKQELRKAKSLKVSYITRQRMTR